MTENRGMGTTFRKYDPEQSFLLPPSPKDWLPGDHLAYFISETVDQLDLSGFYAPYQGDGRRNRPFEPAMMIKILLYCYSTGTFSSRKTARRLYEDVAVRVLAAGNFPAHRTIAEFRQRHGKEFQDLFVEVVRIASEVGLVKLGRLAVDGCKIKANASKHKAMSYGRMVQEEKRLEEEIAELLERSRRVDEAEDEQFGVENLGDEIPVELQRREGRLEKIREAKRRLEERQAEADREQGRHSGDGRKSRGRGRNFKRDFGVPEDKAQENFTDPESRIMKSSGGFEQSYNTQTAVDEKAQIIVATDVTNNASDNGQLLGMVDEVKENLGRHPEQVVADAGYKSEDNFKGLETRKIDGYIALGREGKKPVQADKLPASDRMSKKLATDQGRAIYRRRKAIVEPVFGWVKHVLGFRRFSLRGLDKAQNEWALVCLALNLKRMNGRFPAFADAVSRRNVIPTNRSLLLTVANVSKTANWRSQPATPLFHLLITAVSLLDHMFHLLITAMPLVDHRMLLSSRPKGSLPGNFCRADS